MTRLVLVAGTTATAQRSGLSAAGATADSLDHTPSLDATLLATGTIGPGTAPPMSPTGCPTPAVVSRAVRELVELPLTVVNAGLIVGTAAPTTSVGASPGADIAASEAVPDAAGIISRGDHLGRRLPGPLVIGETIPGGTTTALAVQHALGESVGVSSSLVRNPLDAKRSVVAAGLAASDIEPGDCTGRPIDAIRLVGDPVLAATVGLVRGALAVGTPVTLAGGTQQLTAAIALRHGGCPDPITLATTRYVVDDPAVDLRSATDQFDVDLVVTDPGLDRSSDPGLRRYGVGEAKEGVAMGGAVAEARRAGIEQEQLLLQIEAVTDRVRTGDDP